MMSTLSETPRPTTAQHTATPPTGHAAAPAVTRDPVATDSRLRVVLLLDVRGGAEQRFLSAYDQLRHQVASVPGHVSDQLCQSIENPSQWLITSEWESAAPFLAWVDSEAHREMVRPLRGCVDDTRSLRFSIMRETCAPEPAPGSGGAVPGHTAPRGRLQAEPRIGDGLVRHALTFTVRPGSEEEVARLLAEYAPPKARVDGTTRLCRTSLFMHGNRVVRAVEVTGDLTAALRHVARQPEVREVEEALNPYLEVERDLDDPESARAFFARAALPAVHHLTAGEAPEAEVRRHALIYPVRTGCGAAVARLLTRQDESVAGRRPAPGAAGPGQPGTGPGAERSPLVRSTVFQHGDIVVRLVDLRGPLDLDPAVAAGISGRRAAAVLSRLVDLPGRVDLSSASGPRQFLAECSMTQVTDRRAADR